MPPPKRQNSGSKSAKFSPKMSFLAILCQRLALPAHLMPYSTIKQCKLGALWFSNFWVPKQNSQICPKFAFLAKYWSSCLIWWHTQPKTMRTRWLGGFLRFDYQNLCCAIFTPKYASLGTYRPYRLIWCPVGCGAQAAYFMICFQNFKTWQTHIKVNTGVLVDKTKS